MARKRAVRRTRRSPKRRRRARRSRFQWLRAAFFLGLVGLLGYGAWAVRGYLGSTFEIRRIEVSGNRSLHSGHVLDISGISEGANLLWTSLGKAQERLESDLRIKSAQLRREFPDKVTIEIEERKPFALLVSPTGRHYVDGEGVIFCDLPPRNGNSRAGLPMISLNSTSKEGEWATQAVMCIRAAKRLLPEAVAQATISESGATSLRLKSGLCVRLGAGSASDLKRRMELCAEILRRDPRFLDEAEYIDVSCPGAPACRLKGESAGPLGSGD